jgi:very-short-patch-repair endonuclease
MTMADGPPNSFYKALADIVRSQNNYDSSFIDMVIDITNRDVSEAMLCLWPLSEKIFPRDSAKIADIAVDLAKKLLAGDKDAKPKTLANAIWALGKFIAASSLTPQRKKTVCSLWGKYKVVIGGVMGDENATFLTKVANGFGFAGIDVPEELTRAIEKCKPESTHIHMQVSGKLKEMGIAHENEKFLNGFFVDIYFQDKKLIVELDGVPHQHGDQLVKDCLRDKALEARGYTVLRIQNKSVDEMLRDIEDKVTIVEMGKEQRP